MCKKKLRCDFCKKEVDFLVSRHVLEERVCLECFHKITNYIKNNNKAQEIVRELCYKAIKET